MTPPSTLDELRRASELYRDGSWPNAAAARTFDLLTNPAAVLALLDDIERLKRLALEACDLYVAAECVGPTRNELERITAIRAEVSR